MGGGGGAPFFWPPPVNKNNMDVGYKEYQNELICNAPIQTGLYDVLEYVVHVVSYYSLTLTSFRNVF